ncbi:replication initiation protein [Limobrevibacterium gyesilva]
MFAFSSKYALALYEMVQKRGNLKFKTSEEFPVERFRALLGVDPGKLEAFKSFKQRAIDPAVLEVNGLGEFGCKVEPSAYAGRKVTTVRLSWWAKNMDERKHALNELRFSRVGRRARLKGEVVTVATAGLPLASPQDVALARLASSERIEAPHPKMLPSGRLKGQGDQRSQRPHPNLLPSDGPKGERGQSPAPPHTNLLPSGGSRLTESQLQRFRRDFAGLDIPWLEREFREWVAEQDEPRDYAAAFYGFMKKKKAEM